jgi:adenine-specific DNA methylase
VAKVREQLLNRSGGAHDARLLAVVTTHANEQGRWYRLPTRADSTATKGAAEKLKELERNDHGEMSLVPNEEFTGIEPRRIPIPQYGIDGFRAMFSPRQALVLVTLARLVRRVHPTNGSAADANLDTAVRTLLAFALDKQADLGNGLCRWEPIAQCPRQLFSKQAMSMVWDFAEGVVTGQSSGSWTIQVERSEQTLEAIGGNWATGIVQQASALHHPLPNDSADAVITDPPYYYSVPYSDLSDFFYVWLRRTIGDLFPDLFAAELSPKAEECVQILPHAEVAKLQKGREFYESSMRQSLEQARRFAKPGAIGTVVFAHSDTDAWESLLNALISAGWIVTASWPIDTEMASRIVAQRQVTLASSVHLVCRPREDASGAVTEAVGEWRDVLGELPRRIHEWMPRLAAEGVVGADAIFACLGPALEIFSRYRRVEKANGETATLREYLEFVWAAVSTEALALIFQDADAAGLEPDARLTAMWLWTIGGASNGKKSGNAEDAESAEEDGNEDDEDAPTGKAAKLSGFTLEFDAANRLAMGLGVHLEKNQSIVEVKGDKARLLPVAERAQYLFGKDEGGRQKAEVKRKKVKQQSLFAELSEAEAAEAGWSDLKGPAPGNTVPDRVHQTMILFAANRGELLKRFLVEDGIGQDPRFWKLADNLNKLYPSGTDERRWIEGVLARKKGLGL